MNDAAETRVERLRSAFRRWATIPPWPSFHATKDLHYHPVFKGGLSRWAWRVFTYRFTRGSRWLLLPTFLFFVYGSSSLDMQTYIPFLYIACLWGTSALLAVALPPRLRLSSHFAVRIAAGEVLPVTVHLEQVGRLPAADLQVMPFRLPPEIDAIPIDGAMAPPLRRGDTTDVELGLLCKRRGAYTLRGFRVETDFPLGVLKSYRQYEENRELLVFPQFTPLSHVDIPVGRRYHSGGVALVSRLGESSEFVGNREYKDGDNIRDIDWNATARLNTPIVREFSEEFFYRVGVVLDTSIPRPEREDLDAFEHAVSLAAAVSDYMARQDYLVDLFAAGPDIFHLTLGRSLAYLDQVLDILACVKHTTENTFDVLEPEIAMFLARIPTLVCVMLDWDETRAAFVRRLRLVGTAPLVLVVRDSPCTMDPHVESGEMRIRVLTTGEMRAGVAEL